MPQKILLASVQGVIEDSKLNKFHWKGCPFLASFLSRLSADLDVDSYVQHYWKDFPTVCHMDIQHAKTHQVTDKVLKHLSPVLTKEPPSIFKTLHQILAEESRELEPFPVIPEVTSRTQDIILVFALFTSRGVVVQPEQFVDQTVDIKALEANPKLGNAGRIIDYIVKKGLFT